MRMIRKGKFMVEMAVKNLHMYVPPGTMRDEWLRGVQMCKDTGDVICSNQTFLQCLMKYFYSIDRL